MNYNDLLLKTVFSCMACDGSIASEEIELVRNFAQEQEEFQGMDVESVINGLISQINVSGSAFLSSFLNEINEACLSEEESLLIVEMAIKTIEADNNIEYSEVKFFKKLRKELKISDEKILERMPDKEDYLLPDIITPEDSSWIIHLEEIKLY